jgi:hypothetical protein
MNVLLDECLPRKLKYDLPGHTAFCEKIDTDECRHGGLSSINAISFFMQTAIVSQPYQKWVGGNQERRAVALSRDHF